MGQDITVFLEHRIDEEWVLVDVDPISSADRNRKRLDYLLELKNNEPPNNLSKGAKYWLDDGACVFVASLNLSDACSIWHKTEFESIQHKDDLKTQLLNYFGLLEPEIERFRVIIAML